MNGRLILDHTGLTGLVTQMVFYTFRNFAQDWGKHLLIAYNYGSLLELWRCIHTL